MVIDLKLKLLFIITAVLSVNPVFSAISQKVKYKTTFNNCPSRSAGKFAMRLLKTYERNRSLYDVKSDIEENFLTDKHFVEKYSVNIDPSKNIMNINLSLSKTSVKSCFDG